MFLYHIFSNSYSLSVLTLCPQKFQLMVSFAYSLDPDQAQQNHGTKDRAWSESKLFHVQKLWKIKSAEEWIITQ